MCSQFDRTRRLLLRRFLVNLEPIPHVALLCA